MGSIWGQEKEARGLDRSLLGPVAGPVYGDGQAGLRTSQWSPWPFTFRTSSLFCLYLWSRAGLPSLGNPSPPAQPALCNSSSPEKLPTEFRKIGGTLQAAWWLCPWMVKLQLYPQLL